MGVTIKKGDVISLHDSKSGESSKGKWLMVFKHADKGNAKFAAFVENAADVLPFWDAVKVKDISVTMNNKKDPNTGQWKEQYAVHLRVEQGSADEVGFVEANEDIDDIFR